MTFKEALKVLNIEEYEERIRNCSTSERHLQDYILIAKKLNNREVFTNWFVYGVQRFDNNTMPVPTEFFLKNAGNLFGDFLNKLMNGSLLKKD